MDSREGLTVERGRVPPGKQAHIYGGFSPKPRASALIAVACSVFT